MKKLLLIIGIISFSIFGYGQTFKTEDRTSYKELTTDTLHVDIITAKDSSEITIRSNVVMDSLATFGNSIDIDQYIINGNDTLINFTKVDTIGFPEVAEFSKDILLNKTMKVIFDADGGSGNYIWEQSPDNLLVYINGSSRFKFANTVNVSYRNFVPNSDGNLNLGSTIGNWNDLQISGTAKNATTEIIDFGLVDNRLVFKVSLEMSADDTLFTDSVIIQGGAEFKRFKITLADDAIYALDDATTQMVRCFAIGQDAFIHSADIQATGTVAVIGSGNIANSDSDTDLCVFDLDGVGGGTQAGIKNRLGLEVDLIVEILKP